MLIVLAFGIGLLFKALTVLKSFKKALLYFGLSLLVFLICLIYLYIQNTLNNQTVYLSLLGSFICFVLIAAFLNSKEVLHQLSEKKLIVHSLLFTYLFIVYSSSLILKNSLIFLLILLIQLIAILSLAFIKTKILAFIKFILYVYYLLIYAYFGILLVTKSPAIKYIFDGFNQKVDLIEPFLLGFNSFFLIANLFYIYYLIPFPSKNQSFEERINQSERLGSEMVEKYNDSQLNHIESIFLIFSVIALIVVNQIYRFMTPLMLGLWILFIVQLIDVLPKSIVLKFTNRDRR